MCHWGCSGFYQTISKGWLGWPDVVLGLIYQGAFIALFMRKVGYDWLADLDSKYPISKEEFERGGYAERIRRYYCV